MDLRELGKQSRFARRRRNRSKHALGSEYDATAGRHRIRRLDGSIELRQVVSNGQISDGDELMLVGSQATGPLASRKKVVAPVVIPSATYDVPILYYVDQNPFTASYYLGGDRAPLLLISGVPKTRLGRLSLRQQFPEYSDNISDPAYAWNYSEFHHPSGVYSSISPGSFVQPVGDFFPALSEGRVRGWLEIRFSVYVQNPSNSNEFFTLGFAELAGKYKLLVEVFWVTQGNLIIEKAAEFEALHQSTSLLADEIYYFPVDLLPPSGVSKFHARAKIVPLESVDPVAIPHAVQASAGFFSVLPVSAYLVGAPDTCFVGILSNFVNTNYVMPNYVRYLRITGRQVDLLDSTFPVVGEAADWRKSLLSQAASPPADPNPCYQAYRRDNEVNLYGDLLCRLDLDEIVQGIPVRDALNRTSSGKLQVQSFQSLATCQLGSISKALAKIRGLSRFEGDVIQGGQVVAAAPFRRR